MFYVKDKEENIIFKSTFFRTAHQYAQEFADEQKKVTVLYENNIIIKWFYPDGEEPFYI